MYHESSIYTMPIRDDSQARTAGQHPRHQGYQSERDRYIRFVKYTLLGLLTIEEAAGALRVNEKTIDRWKKALIADQKQDTDDLRKLEHVQQYWRENP